MKTGKKVILIVFVIFVCIQFIPPARKVSEPVTNLNPSNSLDVPDNVKVILQAACYDCHSNSTVYPWYSKVQPMKWLVSHDVEHGKSKLNFDELPALRPRKLKSKLREIESVVRDGSMPLKSYTLLHPDARLSNEQRQIIIAWVKKAGESQ